MNIVLYRNDSEKKRVNKNITELASVTGYFREETSLINPEIDLELDILDYTDLNYLYIEELSRYYFVGEPISISAGLVRVICHIDVLMTYADAIKANKAIIKKSENNWNLYLNDGSFKIYQNPEITVKQFPNGFTGFSWVLAVAGGGSQS